MPTTGCISDAVKLSTKEIMPICEYVSDIESLIIGKIAVMTDCIESLNRWTRLIAIRMR